MPIAAVNAATQAANMNSTLSPAVKAPAPQQAELEKFNQVMFGQNNQMPEQSMVNSVQQNHQVLKTDLAPVNEIAEQGISTEALLSSQAQMLKASVSVDLEAKVAGQLSQAVNKLVTMQ